MTTTSQGGSTPARSALTFEEFVDAALGAAIKVAQRHAGEFTPNPDDPGTGRPHIPGGGPGPIHLPFPIWVGIVAGPFSHGGPASLGNAGGGGIKNG
jgi:hypothetical protein